MAAVDFHVLADAARLIGWAARPRERPARDETYRVLVHRYLEDPEFADVCDRIAAGMDLDLHVDALGGVVADADADSPWRQPLSEVMRRVETGTEASTARKKAIVGATLLAIARVAYPHPAHLDDPERVARVSVAAVVDYLARLAGRIAADAPDPEAGEAGEQALWRAWDALRRGRSGATRASFGDQAGAVKKVCQLLAVEGHLQTISDLDGGTWRTTPRFRVAMTALTEDSDIWAVLLAVDSGDLAAASATTTANEGKTW